MSAIDAFGIERPDLIAKVAVVQPDRLGEEAMRAYRSGRVRGTASAAIKAREAKVPGLDLEQERLKLSFAQGGPNYTPGRLRAAYHLGEHRNKYVAGTAAGTVGAVGAGGYGLGRRKQVGKADNGDRRRRHAAGAVLGLGAGAGGAYGGSVGGAAAGMRYVPDRKTFKGHRVAPHAKTTRAGVRGAGAGAVLGAGALGYGGYQAGSRLVRRHQDHR